jgi:hypothetical protein
MNSKKGDCKITGKGMSYGLFTKQGVRWMPEETHLSQIQNGQWVS